MININEILEEYKPDNDIFSEEEFNIKKLKNIIFNELDEVERRIILIYAETGSLRKLGKELGVCASTALSKIKEIRKKIYDKYYTDNSYSDIHS
mgnify:CR=1 FL=1